MKTCTKAAFVAVVSGLCVGAGAQVLVDDPSAPPALPRYREGGTPYNPQQRLTPYAVRATNAGAGVGMRNANIWTPAEYDPVKGVLYRYFTSQWPTVVAECVAKLTNDPTTDEIAYVTVTNASQQSSAVTQFTAAGANLSRVVFLTVPGDSVWMRDYGPHFVFNGAGISNGALSIVDSHYYPSRTLDNFVPTLVAEDFLGLHNTHMPLYYSGGNFQGGPNRSGFVTALVNLDNPGSAGFDSTFIADLYNQYQGIDTLHIMPQLPFSVDGTGHIDMWMYLIDPEHVIISEFIPGSNATAITVTNNAVPYMQNLGFSVYRPKAWNVGSTHYTYANAYRVNNRIFIPVYGTSTVAGGNAAYNDEDIESISIWNQAVGNSGTAPYDQVDFSRPKVTIVPIQCNGIIPAAGAIHCIVKQVPRHGATIPEVFVKTPSSGDIWLAGTTRTITWASSDENNAAIPSYTLSYSLNGGVTWTEIATTTNRSSYNWTIPSDIQYSTNALIEVRANASDADTGSAANLVPVTIAPGTQKVLDFSSGAGVNKFGYGFQTLAWTNINATRTPVATAVSAANLGKMGVSDATGGDTDSNRYISTTVSANNECTHTYEFNVLDYAEEIDEIDQIVVRWEGYSDNCTQTELYVWDYVQGAWSDARGNYGQNRMLGNHASNRDAVIAGRIDSDFARYMSPSGQMTFLVYAERPADETFSDYMSVTLTKLGCPSDFDGSGFVDIVDFNDFVAAFEAGTDDADFDNSGFVDIVDFNEFVEAFEAGC